MAHLHASADDKQTASVQVQSRQIMPDQIRSDHSPHHVEVPLVDDVLIELIHELAIGAVVVREAALPRGPPKDACSSAGEVCWSSLPVHPGLCAAGRRWPPLATLLSLPAGPCREARRSCKQSEAGTIHDSLLLPLALVVPVAEAAALLALGAGRARQRAPRPRHFAEPEAAEAAVVQCQVFICVL